MSKLALALILMTSQSCTTVIQGPIQVPPQVEPTTPPEEVVAPTTLKVVGPDFHRNGRKVWIIEFATCCGPEEPEVNEWPLISRPLLKDAVDSGVNLVHIRLGPNSKVLESRAWMRPYDDDGGWNQDYFNRVNELLAYGYDLGTYFEIDVVDGWLHKRPEYSPWPDPFRGCRIFQEAPKPIHEKWIRKVVKELGYNQNILWQISNESGFCPPLGTTPQWEVGVALIIRDEERRWKFPEHPIGTNGGIRKADMSKDIQYITTHQSVAAELTGANKPVTVNEYNPFIGVDEFRHQLEQSDKNGTIFTLWLSDATAAERKAALNVVKEWRESHKESK